jgi:hypothetical protein
MKAGRLKACIVSATLMATLAAAPVCAATNLFVNGSFEDGNFTGWKVVYDGFLNKPAVSGAVNGIAPEDGKFQASFTDVGPQISQTVTDIAGEQMAFSFWYASNDIGETFDLILNGKSYPVLVAGTSYQQFSFTFGIKATGSETVEIDSNVGLGQVLLVDNFSLVPETSPVPEVPEATTRAMMLVGLASLGLIAARSDRQNMRRNRMRVFQQASNP